MGFSLLQNSAALLRLTSTEQQEGWKLIQPCCRLRKLLELLSFVVRDPKSSEPTSVVAACPGKRKFLKKGQSRITGRSRVGGYTLVVNLCLN